jgi:hypothetical protein
MLQDGQATGDDVSGKPDFLFVVRIESASLPESCEQITVSEHGLPPKALLFLVPG